MLIPLNAHLAHEDTEIQTSFMVFPSQSYQASEQLLLFSRSVVSDPLRPHHCSTPGFPALHHPLELAQIHVH